MSEILSVRRYFLIVNIIKAIHDDDNLDLADDLPPIGRINQSSIEYFFLF